MQRLRASVQHYDWGDPRFIAQLQQRSPSGRPEAELWMGAHRRAPAALEASGVLLPDAISADPAGMLGAPVARRFGSLPFLAKVLAAARPLSIQAHPSPAQAAEGFARESRAGIPQDARERVYRDEGHKPELICALTSFHAKCGFRPLAETRELVEGLPGSGIGALRERLSEEGADADVLHAVLAWLLRLDAAAARVLVAAVVDATIDAPAGGPFAEDLRWTPEIARMYPGDVGSVVALLLNHVVLEPGQAVFLGAGNLHAYLRGAGVELMANSDNVVRGGLTSKHVDVEELLHIVDATPVAPPVQTPAGCLHSYDAPVPEFRLDRVVVADDVRLRVEGPEIVVVTEGLIEFTTASDQVVVGEPGIPIWVSASEDCYVARGDGTFHRATTPR